VLLEYWNICRLGYFLEILCMKILFYLCAGQILIYLCLMNSCIAYIFLWHPFDSCHNTTFFLGLTGSNISLWCYFWKYFCLNFFSRICNPAAPSTISDRWILWKTDCWSRMFNFQSSWDLRWAFSPSSYRAFRSIPSDLHQLEVSCESPHLSCRPVA
jgi:hypothetical protein